MAEKQRLAEKAAAEATARQAKINEQYLKVARQTAVNEQYLKETIEALKLERHEQVKHLKEREPAKQMTLQQRDEQKWTGRPQIQTYAGSHQVQSNSQIVAWDT